ELAHETLMRSRRRLWLPVDHRMGEMPEIRLRQVAEEPYVMVTVDEASQAAERYWQPAPYRAEGNFRTSAVEAGRRLGPHGPRRDDPLRHGLSAVVARRSAHRNADPRRRGAVDGCRHRLEARRRPVTCRAGAPRFLRPHLQRWRRSGTVDFWSAQATCFRSE